MLLLVTIVLVLIAAVTLLIGIFGDSLALIFVSIGASVLAAVVLGVVSQMTKRRPAEATAGGPAPLATAPAGEPATARIGPVGSAAETVTAAPPSGPPPVPAAAGAAGGLPAALADYDSMRVNDILPRLADLDLDELEAVAEHEESGKNRTSVLNKIDELMDALEAAEVNGAAAPVGAAAGAAGDGTGAALGGPGGFPIADYDELEVDEIVEVLGDLDMDELETVAEYEETHANRDSVLDAIDDRLDELEGLAPAGVAGGVTTVTKAAKKKATAKKSTAKKATAKKSTATRAASSAKKAASRAPAKKASTARTATKKAAPARKAATSAKKATAKKSTAKKATAAKKAAKKATRR